MYVLRKFFWHHPLKQWYDGNHTTNSVFLATHEQRYSLVPIADQAWLRITMSRTRLMSTRYRPSIEFRYAHIQNNIIYIHTYPYICHKLFLNCWINYVCLYYDYAYIYMPKPLIRTCPKCKFFLFFTWKKSRFLSCLTLTVS